MRRALLSLIALSGGCDVVFGLAAPAGDAGTTTDARALPTDRLIVDPDGDSDGDGDPNGSDLCPLIHRDELIGAGTDEDLDGVGDACDPAPKVAGDCLIVFDDFQRDQGALFPAWRVEGAPYGVDDTAGLHIDQPAVEGLLTATPTLRVTSMSVMGYFHIGVGEPRSLQLFLTHLLDGTKITGTACSLARDSAVSKTTLDVITVMSGVDAPHGITGADIDLGSGTDFTLGWRDVDPIDGEPHLDLCRVNLARTDGAGAEGLVASAPEVTGSTIALRLRGLGVDLHAIVGYGKGCAAP